MVRTFLFRDAFLSSACLFLLLDHSFLDLILLNSILNHIHDCYVTIVVVMTVMLLLLLLLIKK